MATENPYATTADAKLLSDFKKNFSARIDAEHGRVSTLETFQKFIDTRGNQIQLTEPAFVKVRKCQETIDQCLNNWSVVRPSRISESMLFRPYLTKYAERESKEPNVPN